MDTKRQPLTIVYAPSARVELNEIWDYNEKTYGIDHAADYVSFLQDGIDGLLLNHANGKEVENFPQLRAMTLKRKPRGHGHTIIYRVDLAAQTIRILHIFHTAQDIQGRMSAERD